jgi:mannose-6-phosphate isomerase-like protein (cupin superfamily)
MNGMRVKITVVMFCLVISLLMSGCAMNKGDNMPSGKVVVIELNSDSEYQPLLGGKPQTCGMRSGRVYLKPSQDCGRHSTEEHEEMLIFLSGSGTALIGEKGDAFEVGKGKICYISPHTIHNIKNTSSEPLIYVYCVAAVK